MFFDLLESFSMSLECVIANNRLGLYTITACYENLKTLRFKLCRPMVCGMSRFFRDYSLYTSIAEIKTDKTNEHKYIIYFFSFLFSFICSQ